jgi:hypothetical protein
MFGDIHLIKAKYIKMSKLKNQNQIIGEMRDLFSWIVKEYLKIISHLTKLRHEIF